MPQKRKSKMYCSRKIHNLSDCAVFFDFDNTISQFDVLDDIIKKFSIDKNWMEFEELWKNGKIGSKECLKNQLLSVRVTKKELAKYLSGIKIDPYFHKLIDLLKKERIKPVILSDNFSFIIKSILENNRVKKIKLYCNSIRFNNDKLIPSFFHTNRFCMRCAHCKKKNLKKNDSGDKIVIYIGDGLSDICPAKASDIAFAKSSLLKYFKKTKKFCIAFKNLKDVYKYLEGLNEKRKRSFA